MTNDELLAIATEFDLGPEPIVMGRLNWEQKYPHERSRFTVKVRNVGHPDNGPPRWAIVKDDGSYCLNKLGQWEWRTRPSDKDEEFYARCRFGSRDEAIAYYQKWRAAFMLLAKPVFDEQNVVNYSDITDDSLKFVQP